MKPSTIRDFKRILDDRNAAAEYEDLFPLAHQWAKEKNADRPTDEVKWSWDCNLKLDFDGNLLNVSSRFYPPHHFRAEYGKYNGNVSIYIGDDELYKRHFESETLDELSDQVESYVARINANLKQLIYGNIKQIFS